MSKYEGFEVIQHQTATEVRLSGLLESDPAVQDRLRDELVGFVTSAQPSNLVINFRNVGRCTTGAINGLLAIRKLLGSNEARIKLCEVCGEVRRTLNVLNLSDSVCEIYDSLAEALTATRDSRL